jgi:hypothetical protein
MSEEIKTLDDVFHKSGCLLNEVSNIQELKVVYQIALELAKKENKIDWLIDWKLEELIGYCGSNNYNFSDFIKVLRILKKNKDYNKQTEEFKGSPLIIPKRPYKSSTMEEISKQLNLPENYINLIYCVLFQNGCLEYGVNLQCSWIDTLGEEIINPFDLGEMFIKEISKDGNFN